MRCSCARFGSLLSLLVASSASAVPVTVPSSLNPGNQYRLAFVTSAERNGASTLIDSYNAFVTNVANTQAALASLGTTWKAIASTATVDARDNTGTNPVVDGVGVPIFLLNDTLLAEDNFDLWDGNILVPLAIDETGGASPQTFVWTGTRSSGVANSPLGTGSPLHPTIGTTQFSHSAWVQGDNLFNFLVQPLYAVSDVLIVVPEPGTGLLVIAGLLSLAGWRRVSDLAGRVAQGRNPSTAAVAA
jgi:hypothetical protein